MRRSRNPLSFRKIVVPTWRTARPSIDRLPKAEEREALDRFERLCHIDE